MPPALVAFMFAIGFATWIFTKVQRSTGGNTQNSIIVSGISFGFAFVILLLILHAIDKSL